MFWLGCDGRMRARCYSHLQYSDCGCVHSTRVRKAMFVLTCTHGFARSWAKKLPFQLSGWNLITMPEKLGVKFSYSLTEFSHIQSDWIHSRVPFYIRSSRFPLIH